MPAAASIHESPLRLGYLLGARRSAGRWWSSDNADEFPCGNALLAARSAKRLQKDPNAVPRPITATSANRPPTIDTMTMSK